MKRRPPHPSSHISPEGLTAGCPYVAENRIRHLNDKPLGASGPVVYWMQQSQRAEENHALAYAIHAANALETPVLVLFCLDKSYPEANLRHYRFMLEGLKELETVLARRNIPLLVRQGLPAQVVTGTVAPLRLLVCDRGYLRHQRAWRDEVAKTAPFRVVEVESDAVVPVETVSRKTEYAARTIRGKIHRHLSNLEPALPETAPTHGTLDPGIRGLDLSDLDAVLKGPGINRNVPVVNRFFPGGTRAARARFETFLAEKLSRYTENRNQPQTEDTSQMSPYLHFGQISPLYLARRIREDQGSHPDAAAVFLEELIVRRELSINFVTYAPHYDAYSGLPNWARQSLEEHRTDPRAHIYTIEQLTEGETHDPYWNAAMREMRVTGYMHNYMRMYWGKKILEWMASPEEAFRTAITLNNRYFLDGRDPNSYAGVGWVFGLHDRPWFERPIFGKIRYMAASGLERKCDIKAYVRRMEALPG